MTRNGADTEAVLASIGRFLLVFQWIESRLEQTLIAGWGADSMRQSLEKLVRMQHHQKVEALRELVHGSDEFASLRQDDLWLSAFDGLLERIHVERNRHTALIRSQDMLNIANPQFAPASYRADEVDEFIEESVASMAAKLLELAEDVGETIAKLHGAMRAQTAGSYMVATGNSPDSTATNNSL